MATQSTDWTMQGMDNPLTLQEKLLDRFEQETGNAIVDPNNTPSVLMEAFASVTSGLVRTIEDTVRPAIYPARANTAEDLYKHLSDYDYVDIFATPSQTTLLMTLDKAYVMANAIQFTDSAGSTYYKIVIPKTTVFQIGDHKFGLYYPIEIRCNIATNRVYIVYDTSEPNPMYSVTSNTLEFDIKEVLGHDIIYLKIPVFQFEVQIIRENLVAGSGFKRVLPYSDRFYAIRAVASVRQNPDAEEDEEEVWDMQEMKLCVSGQSYDPDTPTLIFTPDLDNETLTLEIPYVYFSKDLLRGNIDIEIYTTEGQINYTIPTDTEELVQIDMYSRLTVDDPITQFVDPFRKMPSLTVVPLNTAIIGGSNGMDFETLRQRVVNGTLKTKTLQTPQDIEAYFQTRGYRSTLLTDGVTDRVFIVHAPVTDTAANIITAGAIGTIFDFRDESIKDYQTVTKIDHDTFTVLPSTMYKFNKNTGVCHPLTTNEMSDLNRLTPTELVELFNSETFTVSPFHLHVDIASGYPMTVTYDMSNVDITQQKFIGDRDSSQFQLIMNNVSFQKVKDGINEKYRLVFRISRSGLDDVSAVVANGSNAGLKNFRVFVAMKNIDGSMMYGEAEFVRRDNDFDIFNLDITSNYKFFQSNNEHSIELSMGDYSGVFYLTSELRVIITVNGDIGNLKDPDGDGNYNASRGIETEYTNTTALVDPESYYALTEYKLVCRFGSVVNELDQRINLTYSAMEYLKHSYSKFKVLEYPIYEQDADDTPKVVWNEDLNKYTVNELHPAGKLECMTQDVREDVPLNHRNIGTYEGRFIINDDGTTSAVTSATRGTKPLLNAPLVPQFKVVSATDFELGDSIARGKYELLNVSDNHGPLALPTDVWTKWQETTRLKSGDNWVDEVKVMPILEYLYNLTLTTSATMTYANFKDLAPIAGGVVKVKEIPYANLKAQVPILGDLEPDVEFNAFMYCPDVNDGWQCICQYQSETALTSVIAGTGAYGGYTCGYVYALNSAYFYSLGNRDIYVKYVSFLNTKSLPSGAVIPDMTMKPRDFTFMLTKDTTPASGKTYYTGEEYYKTPDDSVTAFDPDVLYYEKTDITNYYWKNSCQQYPWDAKDWKLLSYTDGIPCVNTDQNFIIALDETRMIKYVAFTSSQLDLDDNGRPQEDLTKPRYIQYMINMLQVDGKLVMTTENKTRNNYIPSVTSVLRTHFDNLGNVRNDMFTNTRLFFEPLRSVGYATFKTTPDKSEEVQLDIAVKLRLHVAQGTATNQTLLDEIKTQIVAIIDESLADGYLNMSEVATRIMTDLHDTVSYVDILGINGDMNLQTLRCTDASVRPHLKHSLKLMDDEITIYADRGLELEYIVEN